jgi:hypothetical protein
LSTGAVTPLAAGAPPSGYIVRRAVLPRDGQCLIGLWRGNLGDPKRMERKFDWFYEHSPTGEPLALLLMHIDPAPASVPEPVGVAAAGRRPFRCGDEPLEAGVLVDMTVSPRHRTLFPALMLQKALRETALAELAFLYGFPNPKAAPVFQRAGYRKLGTSARYVRVLRAAEYLRERIPAWAAVLVGPAWDWLARLRFRSKRRADLRVEWRGVRAAAGGSDLSAVAGRPLVRGVRTPEMLLWRFAAADGRAFECVAACEGDDERGYWIVEGVDGVLQVRDCAPALLAGAGAVPAWNAFFAEARKRRFRSVSFECLAPPEFQAVLERLGMVRRSERPVFGVLRTDQTAVEGAAWYLTAADEDE